MLKVSKLQHDQIVMAHIMGSFVNKREKEREKVFSVSQGTV